MLKIISSPPFDDYSKKLFFQVFGQKKNLGLDSASFVYLWTGPLTNSNTYSYGNAMLSNKNPTSLPKFIDFIFSHSPMLAGKKRFFNSRDEMFSLYLEYVGVDVSREIFDQYYSTYVESIMDRSTMEDMIQEACVNDIVVLFVKDHFRIDFKNSWIDPIPELVTYFRNLCDYFPDKKFIIVTSLENLDKELTSSNCKIVNMGGDITNQISNYMNFTPLIEKSATKNFISLNRGDRPHRVYLVSNLYAKNLHNYGQISLLTPQNPDEKLNETITYDYENDQNYELANVGFSKYLTEHNHQTDDSYHIYPQRGNDNLRNFQDSLQSKYLNSYVEFVSETSYNEKSFNITEKTLHFIYGCNYPIMISSPGVVKFLREMGIDMFDDIIDHSYDDIKDPCERIVQAINKNIEILTMDLDTLRKQWESDKYRMEQNINFVQTKLAKFYQDRFWQQIKGL
jgi:hypothetical protein